MNNNNYKVIQGHVTGSGDDLGVNAGDDKEGSTRSSSVAADVESNIYETINSSIRPSQSNRALKIFRSRRKNIKKKKRTVYTVDNNTVRLMYSVVSDVIKKSTESHLSQHIIANNRTRQFMGHSSITTCHISIFSFISINCLCCNMLLKSFNTSSLLYIQYPNGCFTFSTFINSSHLDLISNIKV